jgi:hypothetical protein
LGRTGGGAFGFGVKVVRAGAMMAAAPFPEAVLEAGDAFLTAGLDAVFFAVAGAGLAFFAGAAFLLAGAAFFGGGAAFFAVTAFLAVAVTAFFEGAVDFFADDAGFFAAVAAFFTTGAAFFFEGAGRFVAAATTFVEVFLFPALEVVAAAARDAGARLTWAPLLAGVIVPSFGPRQVAGCPEQDLAWGAGDDTGLRGTGATGPASPPGWVRGGEALPKPTRSAG